jgi:hypothetical protein
MRTTTSVGGPWDARADIDEGNHVPVTPARIFRRRPQHLLDRPLNFRPIR